MYKQDFVLNNLQGLICHKTNQPTKSINRNIVLIAAVDVYSWASNSIHSISLSDIMKILVLKLISSCVLWLGDRL